MRKIELIIFDLDGTFYNLSDVLEMNYRMQLDFYSKKNNISSEATAEIFEKNGIFLKKTKNSKSATEFFVSQGLSLNEWNDYRETHFDVSVISKENSVKQDLIADFGNIAPLILLSSNSKKNIKKILDYLDVDSDLFKSIICSDNKTSDGVFKKIHEMRNISLNYEIETGNILSIGDRYKTDIEPMLKLNGIGALVNGPDDLKDILDDLKKGQFNKIIFEEII